jgi:acetylornithine deacetylase/succinyl-diaminopimelate desuccinylase-like protein
MIHTHNEEKLMTDNTQTAIKKATDYAHSNRETYLNGFKELLSIPSISTDPAYKDDVQRAADWIVRDMERIGLKNCQAIPTQGYPVVYGEWLEAGKDKPTVLVYAHYDVQPVDPLELWESPPFEATIRDQRIYARGVIDDKAGVYLNLKAFESILGTSGRLPINLKVFFEGEEESGSTSMAPFIKEHKNLLKADLLILSDASHMEDQPMIITSVRGIVDGEVIITGPKRDLHSGAFGGFVHNPIHHAAKIIAAFHDENGRIQIPGFYDDVRPLTPTQLKELKRQEDSRRKTFTEQSGVTNFWGIPDYSILERGTALPTCEINGVYGGYQGPGGKTIIPAMAGFKVSMRLVADQDPDDIFRKFITFIESFKVDTLNIEVIAHQGSFASQLLTEGPAVDALQKAFQATWGKPAMLYRQGGSVPIMSLFQRELGTPITAMSLGTGDNGHAPNEYFILDHFYRNIDLAIHAYHYLADIK